MPKQQTLRERVFDIIDRSSELQRNFALIRLLNSKRTQAEKELKILMREYQIAKSESKVSKQLAEKIALAFKSVYGLSKEKIDVCSQLSECVYSLKKELETISHHHNLDHFHTHKNRSTSCHNDSEPSNRFSNLANSTCNKSKIKQNKMHNLCPNIIQKRQEIYQKKKLSLAQHVAKLEIVEARQSEETKLQ